ncbi:MAG TPA: FtsX-like permease family protein [Gammaproteobacteria bacterium]|nr:FtsX-like permease family protein [Gammaproteobacteria bacterium]
MRALNRKLLRDLIRLRGQVLAIALVLAAGVAGFIGLASVLDSLQLTQARFYADYRFADVFASLRRAPLELADRIRAIPGVAEVDARVNGAARLSLPDFPEPISAQLLSLPAQEDTGLNRLYLRVGRLPLADRADEVVVGEAFAEAHRLRPGARLTAVLNGREQALTVVGIGLSPEFVYQIGPGEIVPDFRTFAVLWMQQKPLAAAFDLEDAFNDVVLRLAAGGREQDVIDRLDQLLAPYGGRGAYGRELQLSHRYLSQEMASLEVTITTVPLIFLAVAAFLLNIVVSRLIRNQREQIAILKAFGYGNAAVGRHYLALVLMVVLLGGVLGIALGLWLGQALSQLYSAFFRFPFLDYHLRLATVAISLAVTAGAVVAGTLGAVWRAVRLPPAEAMRPEPPASYRASLLERLGFKRLLDQPDRMIVRHLERQPVKSLLSILGIAFAVAIMMVGRFSQDAINYIMDIQFKLAAREDFTVSLVEPTSRPAIHSLAGLSGVWYAEPFRSAPVELRNGYRSFRTSLQGYVAEPQLHRLLDTSLQPLRLPTEGVLLTDYLGKLLAVQPGDWLEVEVLEGARRRVRVPVAGLVHEYIGVAAYMELDALNRLLGEGDAINGAFLAIDLAAYTSLQRALGDMPQVAAVGQREQVMRNFDATMGEVTGRMNIVVMLLAGIIAFGIVYNSARIALAERAWELASLRVLGYSKAEVAYILVGELALLTLVAIVPGFFIGNGLSRLILLRFESDLYRLPVMVVPATYAMAAGTVLLAALLSAALVVRQLNRLDMVSALKARE